MVGLAQVAWRTEDTAAVVGSTASSDFACGRDAGPRPRGVPSAPSRGADVVMVRRTVWSLAACGRTGLTNALTACGALERLTPQACAAPCSYSSREQAA